MTTRRKESDAYGTRNARVHLDFEIPQEGWLAKKQPYDASQGEAVVPTGLKGWSLITEI